jgi:selenocysteine lyase/cysteine desulfurase
VALCRRRARASLELITGLGLDEIVAHDLRLARRFCSEAGLPEPATPIVRVETQEEADTILARLRAAGVKAAARDGAVRISFHFYNDDADVTRALDALAGFRL